MNNNLDREEGARFEDEVRRIARLLWPIAQYAGAELVDGRERDGIFETEECTHLIEATVSNRLAKAQGDIGKLIKLASTLRKSGKPVQCWFITRGEPTVDQRHAGEKHKSILKILSFAQFQSRLIDARSYLVARGNYGFGSVRDPQTGQTNPSVEYVDLCFSDQKSEDVKNSAAIVEGVKSGHRYVLLGDYGAGKSMTLRHIFRELMKSHYQNETSRFPVCVNLRDHYGQSDPAEVLERHARNVGFSNPWHLVRAWRAGYVHLLLDGFDEVTTLNVQGLWRKLSDNRFRAMEAIRRLVREHPSDTGIVIAGRAHFFDSPRERRNALGLTSTFAELSLNEFTEDQIHEYLHLSGYAGLVPQWMPSRPLLIAYLATRGLLPRSDSDAHSQADVMDRVAGWDDLLDRVTAREAEIEPGIDGPTVRRILERLGTKARSSPSGHGPITVEAIVDAYKDVCGYVPDEKGMVLLQRLPGLGVESSDEGSRSFIDEDFADTCRAGDLVEFVENPFGFDQTILGDMESPVGELGVSIAARRVRSRDHSGRKINAAAQRAQELSAGNLLADVVRVAISCGEDINPEVVVRDVVISEFELTSDLPDASRLTFQGCLFSRVSIDMDAVRQRLPRFARCYISELEGPTSVDDLPGEVFNECDVDRFVTHADTTDQVLALSLPLGSRVMLTVLKKLFQRRGSGRKENALQKGLDHHARRLVPDVLRLLQTQGVAKPYKHGGVAIWIPDRKSTRRVGQIIASPTTSQDLLLRLAGDLD